MHLAPPAAAVRRSNQQFFEQIARRETLPCGYAYFNPQHAELTDCSFVAELTLIADAPDPLALIDAHFGACGGVCRAWMTAAEQPVEPVAALLAPRGAQRHELTAWSVPPTADAPDVDRALRVVGARALRRGYTRLTELRFVARAAQAELHLDRLNDPQYDAFVALRGDQPVGTIALHQVGEIGRVRDLFVPPECRGQGIARNLLHYAVRAARRWALRPVCAAARADDQAAAALLRAAGFEADGAIAWFALPDATPLSVV